MMHSPSDYARSLYGSDVEIAPCPFTPRELAELPERNELLVYVPARLTMAEMATRWGVKTNIDFGNEKMIRNVMTTEPYWFVTSGSKTPELLYQSGHAAKRLYEDEGLHGLDVRRYLAFAASFRLRHDRWPDETYWTFLLSGSYDRSGISIIGFDAYGVLSHHGWMKDFKAKYVGSRYAVLAPRIEITAETEKLPRAYRGRRGSAGLEASMD